MKPKKSNNKFSLRKETIAALNTHHYQQIEGGMAFYADTFIGCHTLVFSCVETWPTHTKAAYC